MYFIVKSDSGKEYRRKKMPKGGRFKNIQSGVIYKVYERQVPHATIFSHKINKIVRKA